MYSSSLLDQKRFIADLAADNIIAQMAEEQILYQWLPAFNPINPLPNEPKPNYLSAYFEQNNELPAWADEHKIQRATHFFRQNAQNILTILGFYSLPYCYMAANGAKVLYASERIRNNTTQRLRETGFFVLEAMQADTKKRIETCKKIRLMHAAARFFVQQKQEWQTAQWGVPINQEDMAGTNLSFSLIVIRGLRKMGIATTADDANAYIHHWNVIGHFLGIDEDLLPTNTTAAHQLEKKISQRQFKPSEEGILLTEALHQSLCQQLQVRGLNASWVNAYLHFFLGEKIASQLSIPRSNQPTTLLLKSLKMTNIIQQIAGITNSQEKFIKQVKKQIETEHKK